MSTQWELLVKLRLGLLPWAAVVKNWGMNLSEAAQTEELENFDGNKRIFDEKNSNFPTSNCHMLNSL